MYRVKKTIEIAGAHKLSLNYPSKCQNLHGHNWIITVYCQSENLDVNGMVCDFTIIKDIVMRMDHKNINELMEENPTAENMARFICEKIGPPCYKVEVQESEGNVAEYEKPASD